MADLYQRWAGSLLGRLGIPENRENLRALVGWARAEGGHVHNSARFNLLNTTQPMPGAGNTGSQGNIKVYRGWNQGLRATTRTLRNGRYGGILSALRSGTAEDVARAVGQSPWGTSGDLLARTIASTPAFRPSGATLGGAGGSPTPVSGASPGLGVQGGSGGTLALLQALQGAQQPAQAPSSGLASPAHSAAPVLPAGAQAPLSGGGPAPKMDTGALIAGLQAQAATTGDPAAALQAGVPSAAPAGAKDRAVQNIVAAAEKIDDARVPYQWGGGHAAKQKRFGPVTPLDCSGAVSRVLGINPLVSGQFASWGKSGRGKRVSIYANGEHVLMEVDGRFFGTSRANPGGGAGWIPRKFISKEYLSRFNVRHPPGM